MKTILVDAWNTFITEKGINENLKQLLDSFLNNKIIVTNANTEELKKLGIINMPYPVFSLQHKPDKVNPIYFKKMLDFYHLNIDQVVYFEHNYEAVKSAESIGILSYHFTSDNNLENLSTFLKSNI